MYYQVRGSLLCSLTSMLNVQCIPDIPGTHLSRIRVALPCVLIPLLVTAILIGLRCWHKCQKTHHLQGHLCVCSDEVEKCLKKDSKGDDQGGPVNNDNNPVSSSEKYRVLPAITGKYQISVYMEPLAQENQSFKNFEICEPWYTLEKHMDEASQMFLMDPLSLQEPGRQLCQHYQKLREEKKQMMTELCSVRKRLQELENSSSQRPTPSPQVNNRNNDGKSCKENSPMDMEQTIDLSQTNTKLIRFQHGVEKVCKMAQEESVLEELQKCLDEIDKKCLPEVMKEYEEMHQELYTARNQVKKLEKHSASETA